MARSPLAPNMTTVQGSVSLLGTTASIGAPRRFKSRGGSPIIPIEIAVDTHQKALQVNLDLSLYGTFAEIGAGQEVARWFFRVGGAAGTIAKAMSAYDMTFS